MLCSAMICVCFPKGSELLSILSRLRSPAQARALNAAGLAYATSHVKLTRMSFQSLGCNPTEHFDELK